MKKHRSSLAAFVMMLCILLGLFMMLGFAPFGNRALTWEDANIQYLDFFAYFKDVLAGKNDIGYTFGKTLGGSNAAVFSYYLSSPFSLLIAFFDQTQFHVFFNLVIALKMSLAAATCALFLDRRFDAEQGGEHSGMVVLLSLGYALSHYCATQNSNIMWMDGVYMLPLILLGVYELVQGRRSWMLSLMVGLSILFNWYSAGINCLFSAVYMLAEVLLVQPVQGAFKSRLKIVLRYAAAMIVGVLVSAVLFLPTIAAMGTGNRSGLEWGKLLDFSFLGEIPDLIHGFVLGYRSESGKPSLFCGSLAVLGVLGFFTSKDVSKREKLIAGMILGILVLCLYFGPLVMVFSLLKTCTSYWYRYTYGVMLVMIWLAAWFLIRTDASKHAFEMIRNAFLFVMALVLMNYIRFTSPTRSVYMTGMIFFAIACALGAYLSCICKGGKALIWVMLALLVMGELAFSTKQQFQYYQKDNVCEYQRYVTEQRVQIEEIQSRDPGLYRISQTATRGMDNSGITANYNEALGFNYWSISGYTSSPDDVQREMLNRFGYPICGENMCIVNTSILPVDALLGVKYVLSRMDIEGLQLDDSFVVSDGKHVYVNPYALPMAFVYQDKGFKTGEYVNPFVYQNQVYSQLLGEDVELYQPVEYQVQEQISDERVLVKEYILEVPQGNYVLYGNLPWQFYMNADLHVNGVYTNRYSSWLSGSVFYIPAQGDMATVRLDASSSRIALRDEQFYALNLDLLADVCARISARSVMENTEIQNGYARFEVDGIQGDYLYVSIPYDRGWSVMRNGEKIEPALVAGCMYAIELNDGENLVEMTYRVRFLREGMLLSCAGMVLVLLMAIHHKRKNRIRE